MPYRVVKIAGSELGRSLTAGLGGGLNVAMPWALADEDTRPSRYATPALTMLLVMTQTQKSETKRYGSTKSNIFMTGTSV